MGSPYVSHPDYIAELLMYAASLWSMPRKVAPPGKDTTTPAVLGIVTVAIFALHHLIDFDSSRHHKPPGVRVLVTGISRDTSWQVG